MKIFIDKLKDKQDLSFNESKNAFEILMDGKASDDEIFDFLTLLSSKGEISDEIAGGVFVLRNKSKRVNVKHCIDTCGTGGDGMNTLNISTASALLLSSMGIKVAKHGNKAVSSKCGSGDVLEALNIKIDLEPKDIEEQIKKNNFGFMFAPNYHSAMRFVGPTRKKIGKRTIFNMIGPLSSPALVDRQVIGVFDKKLLKIFANALNNLDIKFAWIVNSEDGLDEISPYAKTNVIQLKDGKISEIIIDPKALNVNAEKFDNLIGDDANFNATIASSIATKLPLAGGTMTGNLSFGDNNKAIFGAGSDLQIYHDASNSYIKEVGTGKLSIQTNGAEIAIQGRTGTEFMARFEQDGWAKLYYDNAEKIATTSTGVSVTGNITVSGTVDGRNIDTDGTKLDTIETNADVTDTTNVLAALPTLTDNQLWYNIGGNMVAVDGTLATDAYLGSGNSAPTGGTATITGNMDISGNFIVGGTVDGVDIASRDGILTSTTTTASDCTSHSCRTFSANRNRCW